MARYQLVAWLLAASAQAGAGIDITPHVGAIEIYGARKVQLQKIEKALGMRVGDFLMSRQDAEDRIDKVPNILVSRVEAACCSGKDMILYVGVEERDSPHIEFHPAPTGVATLPPGLLANYRRFLDEVEDSLHSRNADEDLTNGYSLMADPDSRSLQKSFIVDVENDLPNLSAVVRESFDPEQRAAAAYLFQYAPRGPRSTPVMINSVQWALQDNEDSVRQSAMLSLRAILVGAKLHPEQEIHFEATWLVSLLNSVVW